MVSSISTQLQDNILYTKMVEQNVYFYCQLTLRPPCGPRYLMVLLNVRMPTVTFCFAGCSLPVLPIYINTAITTANITIKPILKTI